MSSGQQYWADKLREDAELEAASRLNSDSIRLGINTSALKTLRDIKYYLERNINQLPYGFANELKRLLDTIKT